MTTSTKTPFETTSKIFSSKLTFTSKRTFYDCAASGSCNLSMRKALMSIQILTKF